MNVRVRLLSLSISAFLAGPVCALDLVEAYERAQKNDPVWAATNAGYQAEREVINQSRAGLLPQIGASASYNQIEPDPEQTSPQTSAFSPSNGYSQLSYGAQLRQPLFNLDHWYRYQAAKSQVSKAEANYRDQEQNLALKVAEAYFNVLRAEEQLAYAKAEEAAFGRQLEQSRKRFEVGLIAITEVLETQAGYDRTRASRLVAEAQLDSANETLSAIIGSSDGRIAALKSDLPVTAPTPAVPAEWVKRAREQNPQLLVARHNHDSAQAAVRQARGGHAPTLDLVASYRTTDTGGKLFSDGNTLAYGVELNVPIFTGGLTQSSVRSASYQETAARETVSATERQVVRTTNTLYRAVQTDAARVDASRQGVISSTSAVEATRAGYEVGTRNVVDVLQAERALYAAKADYANARYDYVVNGLRLKASAGQLSAVDIRELNRWLDPSASVISADSLLPEPAKADAPAKALVPAPSKPKR